MIFWLVWGFCNLDRAFTFQCGFQVVGVGLIDFGVIVLNVDSFFGDCLCLELGGVSCVKSQISISSMFSLALTSKISSITFVMVEGS